ncbi:N-acetylmuramoyl-L-alanine amidase [Bradyrhizobium sp. USDA 313]|uniref:peptidoglycan recognition protein family protein n=1 Tax=Bradyrhizobium sp. USDA 313 TaxID=3156307 RepID=UPI0035160B2F
MSNDNELEMTFRLVGTPQAVASIEQLRRLLAQTGQKRDISPMQRELDHLRAAMRGISQEISSVVKPALGGFTLSLSGIILGLSAAAVGLNRFAGGLVEIKEGADRIGMTIQQYRGFMDAAARVNIAKPEAIQMMENFNKVVYEAKLRIHGTWEEIVRLGGADVVGSVLNAKNQVDQMAIVWQRLEELKKVDPAKARAWAELWFNNIKAARIEWNDAMEAMARASGMTDQQIQDAKKYHDEWIKASLQWDKLKLTVGTAAMQALDPLVKALTQALQNKEAITALADGLNKLTSAVAGMTPDDVSRLGKSIGEFIKGVGEGLGALAKGLTDIMDFIDRTQKRSAEGKSAFGTYDVGKGRLLTDEEEAASEKKAAELKAQREAQDAKVASGQGPSFWSDFGNWWRSRVGLPIKETGEKAEKANVEFQQLVEDMRKAQGGGGGGGNTATASPAPSGPAPSTPPSSTTAAPSESGAARKPGPRVENVPNPAEGANAGGLVTAPAVSKQDQEGVNAFIMHHTGGRGTVEGVQNTLRQRGLGVEYIMDRDGNIVAAGPRGSSHMRTGWGPIGTGLSNRNTVGMEVIAKDDKDVTPAQVAAAKKFIAENFPNTPVYGHGQVNPGHKEADEGMTIVNAINAQRGNKFDALTAGKTGAAAASRNTFDVTIDASAMDDAKKGVARIPSTLFNNSPSQTPTMPATGKAAAD